MYEKLLKQDICSFCNLLLLLSVNLFHFRLSPSESLNTSPLCPFLFLFTWWITKQSLFCFVCLYAVSEPWSSFIPHFQSVIMEAKQLRPVIWNSYIFYFPAQIKTPTSNSEKALIKLNLETKIKVFQTELTVISILKFIWKVSVCYNSVCCFSLIPLTVMHAGIIPLRVGPPHRNQTHAESQMRYSSRSFELWEDR